MFLNSKKSTRKTWRKRNMMIPCKSCGSLSQTKNRHYVLCVDCMKNYLENLETMALENKRMNQSFEVKKKQYNSLYKKIERTKEKLCDIPRKLEVAKAVDRDCLKCNRGFIAVGKFNRICHRCTDANREIEEFYL